jgi:hypothetical protein
VWLGVVSCRCRDRLVREEVLVSVARRGWRDACCRSTSRLSCPSYCAGELPERRSWCAGLVCIACWRAPTIACRNTNEQDQCNRDAGLVVPNTLPHSRRSVGHFSRATAGQFSRASKQGRAPAVLVHHDQLAPQAAPDLRDVNLIGNTTTRGGSSCAPSSIAAPIRQGERSRGRSECAANRQVRIPRRLELRHPSAREPAAHRLVHTPTLIRFTVDSYVAMLMMKP